MALTPKLKQTQSQKLSMTPQMRQAIGLLQMSNLELSAFLQDAAERNPLLSVELPEAQAAQGEEGTIEAQRPAAVDQRIQEASPGRLVEDYLPAAARNLFDDEGPERSETAGAEDAPTSLRADLLSQLGTQSALSPAIRTIASALVHELDERGYLGSPVFEVADRYGVPGEAVERGLAALQSCEPAGIGARDLAECLELQLVALGHRVEAFRPLLAHLPLLAEGRRETLSATLGVPETELAVQIAVLRQLDPKPGRALSLEPVVQAVPDVFVRPDAQGGWQIELNTETLPRALLDEEYARHLTAQGDTVISFVEQCRADAGFILRGIEHRAFTVLNTASALVSHQERFFREGLSALRPLTMAEIASDIDVSESTVSRVVNGKFLHCPRGTFELRFFFSQGPRTDNPDAPSHAATALQDRIRKLIAGENPQKPLSDDRIVALMKDDGINIARRTVAKYREGMGISSSVQRRRQNSGLFPG
ncbi:MAG: RNA polymerase factor sigma-54 [Pseudomonadota bacterium]